MKLGTKIFIAAITLGIIYSAIIFYAVKEVRKVGLKSIVEEIWEGSNSER